MSLSFSKKNKCQGCQALCSTKSNYTCGLGFKISFKMDGDDNPWQPQPEEKCYKPKSIAELREARKIIKQKAPKVNAA